MNRSYLMVAGDKQKHLDKLPSLQCDVAMINLEDGVHDKKFARELLKKNFNDSFLQFENLKTVVRVNPLDECGGQDIELINTLKPDAIRIPKIKNIKDVKTALKLIDKGIEVHLSIETKEAFNSLNSFKIDTRVTTVYLGILDLMESLSLPQSLLKPNNPTIDYILSKFLIDSKLAGFYPISFTYQDHKNNEEFQLWCQKVKEMGYTAKATISPTQVEIVNRVFNHNEKAIQKAKYIKNIFEQNKHKGVSGFVDETYGFIDEPIYKDALLILRQNR